MLKGTEGKCFLAVYADDFIAGFQHKSDAERYYAALKERLGKFNLELEESKSRLIEFGRFAEGNSRRRYGKWWCKNATYPQENTCRRTLREHGAFGKPERCMV